MNRSFGCFASQIQDNGWFSDDAVCREYMELFDIPSAYAEMVQCHPIEAFRLFIYYFDECPVGNFEEACLFLLKQDRAERKRINQPLPDIELTKFLLSLSIPILLISKKHMIDHKLLVEYFDNTQIWQLMACYGYNYAQDPFSETAEDWYDAISSTF